MAKKHPWLDRILNTGKAVTVPTAAAAAGAVGTVYVTKDGKFVDAAGGLIETLNETVGEAQARAGAQIGAEKLYAFIEQVGIFINNIMGGDSSLGLINWARKAQGIGSLVATNDGLVPADSMKNDSNSPSLEFNGLTAEGFSSNLTDQIMDSQKFEKIISSAPGNSGGVSAEQLANAATINSVIRQFNPSELIVSMERAAAPAPTLRDSIAELDREEHEQDFKAIQAKGLEGLTTLFGQMAEGQEVGKALESTKTLLNISAPAPGQ